MQFLSEVTSVYKNESVNKFLIFYLRCHYNVLMLYGNFYFPMLWK